MTSGTNESDIELNLSGTNTLATAIAPARLPAIGGVVFFHGRGGSRNRHLLGARRLASCGVAVLAFDSRGCGTTVGDPDDLTLEDYLDDAVAAYDLLCELPDVTPLYGCYGSSFGGYLAARLSESRSVHSLVLRAPSVYPRELLTARRDAVDENQRSVWRYRERVRTDEDPGLRAIGRYEGDLLVVGAGRDDEVPSHTVEMYFHAAKRAARREIVWFEEATHSMKEPSSHQRFNDLMCEWFVSSFTHSSPVASIAANLEQ